MFVGLLSKVQVLKKNVYFSAVRVNTYSAVIDFSRQNLTSDSDD